MPNSPLNDKIVLNDYERIIISGGGLAGVKHACRLSRRGVSAVIRNAHGQTPSAPNCGFGRVCLFQSWGHCCIRPPAGFLIRRAAYDGSLLIQCALDNQIPAGKALAVDRAAFSRAVQERLQSQPNIEIVRKEVRRIPNKPTILASGPLTSPALARSLKRFTHQKNLFFYDAVAPIIEAARST